MDTEDTHRYEKNRREYVQIPKDIFRYLVTLMQYLEISPTSCTSEHVISLTCSELCRRWVVTYNSVYSQHGGKLSIGTLALWLLSSHLILLFVMALSPPDGSPTCKILIYRWI